MGIFITVIVVIFCVAVVVGVIGNYIYKSSKGLNKSGCDGSCSYVIKRGLNSVRKELEKERCGNCK